MLSTGEPLAQRMLYLAAKTPEDVWPEFKVRAQAAYQAPSRAIARELAAGGLSSSAARLTRFLPSLRKSVSGAQFTLTLYSLPVSRRPIGFVSQDNKATQRLSVFAAQYWPRLPLG